jgi:hypothetical protein
MGDFDLAPQRSCGRGFGRQPLFAVTSLICVNRKSLYYNTLYILHAEERMMTDSCCCGTQTEAAKQPALEILKERFARGELDKAEFEERRQVLSTLDTPAVAANKGKGCC